ncbi:MAG: helix-turn-helix transcriptional regulator [Alphaproteobacteria bacterium]|nr:helix-turn-helix transcriptional regulator [Alphaproteobacteria bacterium]
MPYFSLSAQDFEPSQRVPAFQDAAASICKLQISPADPHCFTSTTSIAVLPDAVIASTVHAACVTERTTALAADEPDNILIHAPQSAGFAITQRGGEDVECGSGMLYIDPNEVPGIAQFSDPSTHVLYISIPRRILTGSGLRFDGALRKAQPITPHWRLFLGYAQTLYECQDGLSAEAARTCTSHLHDLARMALADGQLLDEAGPGRGTRAAWLHRLKADIETELAAPDLSLDRIAGRHGISARYARALFAAEHTTFRDYVKQRRLALAHAMLCDLRQCHRSVSDIAMASGFGDLSWFNASYRQQFGMTPSASRAAAAQSSAVHP